MNKSFLLNDLLRRVMEDGSYRYPGFSPGYPAWNLLYYIFACVYKPNIWNVVVETGTCRGLSTIVMAQVIRDFGYQGKIYTIELSEDNLKNAEGNIEGLGLSSYVQTFLGDSKEVLNKIIPTFSRLDFVFLDDNHSCDTVYSEFEIVKDLVKKSKGYIYFDNTTSGGVYEDLQKIKYENPDGNLVMFPNCSWSPPGQAIWSF